MTENEVEKLLHAYRDSLGTSGRRVRAPSPWRRRTAWALVTASAAAIIVVGAMWPRDADAAALRRIRLALKNAHTMEETFSMQTPGGAYREFLHDYYKDGAWRCEVHKGTGLAATYVLRSGLVLTDFDRLDHATLEPADPKFFADVTGSDTDALSYVKDQIDIGRQGLPRRISIQPHDPVDGVPTYVLTLDRAEDAYHAEILVDKRTDLPISDEVAVIYEGRGVNRYRQAFRFDQPQPDSLFALASDKPVVRVSEAQSELLEDWKKTLAAVDGTEVRDACVTPDGTIWIAVTTRRNGDTLPVPDSVVTPEGGEYARILDLVPSAIVDKEKVFQWNGESVLVEGFVPLDPAAKAASAVTVKFANRPLRYPGFAALDHPKSVAAGSTAALPLRRESRELPAYFTALDLDYFGLQIPIEIWETRADALEKSGRLLDAAHAYEQTAVAYRSWVKYVGYRPLEQAAKCYRKLGLTLEAERDEAAAKTLKATRER